MINKITDKPVTANISIANLKKNEVDKFIRIMWDSFEEKLIPTFSNNRKAGIEILIEETSKNLKSNKDFVAKASHKIIGVTVIKTTEIAKKMCRKNPKLYFQKLGFLKAIKALLILSLDNFIKIKKDTLYIDTLAVDYNLRGKGVGKKILYFVEDYARKHNKKYLTLGVFKINAAAYNLYKNFGFKKIKEYSTLITEWLYGYREWMIMRKEIL